MKIRSLAVLNNGTVDPFGWWEGTLCLVATVLVILMYGIHKWVIEPSLRRKHLDVDGVNETNPAGDWNRYRRAGGALGVWLFMWASFFSVLLLLAILALLAFNVI